MKDTPTMVTAREYTVTLSMPLYEMGEAHDGTVTLPINSIQAVIKNIDNNVITVKIVASQSEHVVFDKSLNDSHDVNKEADLLVEKITTVMEEYHRGIHRN